MRKSIRYIAQAAAWTGIALAAAAILAPIASAQHAGRFEGRGEPHSEPRFDRRPAFGPHVRFDDRFHHNHFYPALGFAIATLPLGYAAVHGFDGDYYFHAGVWYRHAGPNYVVVGAPIGAVIPVLPPAYTTVWAGNVPYYYANRVYYAAAPGGYAVVQAPPNASPTPPAQAASAPAPAGSWYYCASANAYYPYVQQ